MLIAEITMSEFKRGLRKTKTLIVPYGTVEAHGTHLPLSTDTMIMWETAKKAAERVSVFVAPPVHYGVCTSTAPHPGTIGITPDTLRHLTLDIVRDGVKKGLKNFILISGHGGGLHLSALREAGERLTQEIEGIKVAALMVYEICYEQALALAETEGDSHAGELETSLIMHLAPELVKGRGKKERPRLPRPIIARDKLKYWPGAVDGDPTKATKKKGETLFEIMVEKVVGLVKDIERLK